MKKRMNENGYALVTVLLIITVFIILFLSFVGQSFSTVKQNEMSENRSQAIALAEMGVNYFETKIHIIKNEINDEINKLIEENIDPTINAEFYKEKAVSLLKDEVKGFYHQQIINSDTNFEIKVDDDFDPSVDIKVEIPFQSIGNKGNERFQLTGTLTVNLLVSEDSSNNGENTEPTKRFPSFNIIPRPNINDTMCLNPNSIPNQCNEILFTTESSTTLSGNINGLTKKTIFSEGPLIIDGNGNQMEDIKFHSDDSITFKGNLNHVGLFIEAKGTAKFEKNIKTEKSKIYVSNNLEAPNGITLDADSFVYIGGSLIISDENNKGNKHLNIKNSTVCINGAINSNKLTINISNGGELVINEQIDDKYKDISGLTVATNQEFLSKCGVPVESANLEINWSNDIKRNIEYKY